jgi:hypothetical protein
MAERECGSLNEVFLAALWACDEAGADFVNVVQRERCVDAVNIARSWLRGEHGDCRRASVWVGDYQVFDGDRVVDFDLAAKHRSSLVPVAPGRYRLRFEGEGIDSDYVFDLLTRGLGQ